MRLIEEPVAESQCDSQIEVLTVGGSVAVG